MNEIYPVLLTIMNFLLLLSLFFCFQTNRFPKNRSIRRQTDRIDVLIHLKQTEVSVENDYDSNAFEVCNTLSRYNIKYTAWRAIKNR